MTRAIRVVILGKVQGVWYRAWTVEQATRRGLSGWVRNRPDGSVEALFSGAAVVVEAMIEACREGPPAARVDRIEQHPADPPAEPGFRQVHTE
ncbi:MAG: acylphosphatase [Alphaproteobacteria bacterium]|nr:acylphosphatase [Alphaproteobacteria bacterium]